MRRFCAAEVAGRPEIALIGADALADGDCDEQAPEAPPVVQSGREPVAIPDEGPKGRLEDVVGLHEPPDAVVEEGTDGKRRTRGTYTLKPLGPQRTEVTFTNEILQRGSKLEALADPLVKAMLKRNNAKALARLKEIMES